MEECIFCKIAEKKIPSEIVYETNQVVAFRDVSPKAPIHILIIPKQHINPKTDLKEEDVRILPDIFLAAKIIAANEGIGEKGFRLIANVGPDSGQEVDHLHFHLLGGKPLGGLVGE